MEKNRTLKDSYKHDQLFFDKCAKAINWSQKSLQQMGWLAIYRQIKKQNETTNFKPKENPFNLDVTAYIEINFFF